MKTMKLFVLAMFVFATCNVYSQDYTANTKKSTIKWEAKKIGGEHNGNIQLKEGNLSIKDDKIANGTFVIDMTSITNNDIESDEYKMKLINHLKSEDFFSVVKFPTSTLKVTNSTMFNGNKSTVTGDLTIKGITHPIIFDVTRDGKQFMAKLVIDRAKYDVRYGSKSFFDNLGDKVIYDEFTLDVNLVVD